MNRREWLYGVGLSVLAAHRQCSSHIGVPVDAAAAKAPTKPLDLSQYEPKSMLQVHESQVDKGQISGH